MRELLRFIVRNYFVLLFLLLEGISFMMIVQFNSFQKSRFVNFSRSITGYFFEEFSQLRDYLDLREQNADLIAENVRLRNELEKEPEYIYLSSFDSIQFDTLADSTDGKYFYSPARIVNNSVSRQYNVITINQGTNHGIHSDMAVISEMGVAGIVAEASPNFATVIPIINRNFRLSAKIKKNNYFGIIEWEGKNPDIASLREIPVHVELNDGDTIITSGFSSIFPEGILVGVIESHTFKSGNYYQINVRLATNFRRLQHVNIINSIYSEEQKALENTTGND